MRNVSLIAVLFLLNIIFSYLILNSAPSKKVVTVNALSPEELIERETLRYGGYLEGSDKEVRFHELNKKYRENLLINIKEARLEHKKELDELKSSILYKTNLVMLFAWLLLFFFFINIKEKISKGTWLLFGFTNLISYVFFITIYLEIRITSFT